MVSSKVADSKVLRMAIQFECFDNDLSKYSMNISSSQLLIFIYANSKLKVTFKKADFDSGISELIPKREKKSFKISNITFAILPFSHKITSFKKFTSLSTYESTSIDETIRCILKWLSIQYQHL